MEKETIKSLLKTIDQEVSSCILGGMTNEYNELEGLGYIKIDRNGAQHRACITPNGLTYLYG